MTREECHNLVKLWIEEGNIDYWKHYGKVELHRDIDRIYDDFENRTCNNCVHYKPALEYDCTVEGTCELDVCMDYENLSNMVSSSFGCNEWESK